MSNTVGYSLGGCTVGVRYTLTQGEDATGNPVEFRIPACKAWCGDGTYVSACLPGCSGGGGDPYPVGLYVSSRSRGGTATLVGFSEYTTPTTPPRKFLQITFSGVATIHIGLSDCVTAICTNEGTISGGRSYNPATGVITETGYHDVSGTCGSSHAPIIEVFSNTAVGDYVTSGPLARITLNSLGCYASGPEWIWRPSLPTYREDLSNEYTESDAVATLSALLPAWDSVAWGTGLSASSLWDVRTPTGFSFAYREAQVDFTGSGFTPSSDYILQVVFEHRFVGGSTWVDSETQDHLFTTDGSGAFEYPVDVPISVGYETRVKSYSITPQ